MQIHVKSKHVYEGQFEILGGRIIGIGDQALSIFILNRRAQLAQECLSLPRAVPANDRWRNFFCHAIHQECGVTPAGGNRLTHLATDGLLCTSVLQEACVGHPRNIHDHANTIFEGLVEERNRWDSVGKDAIDASISHQGEVNFDLIRFGELGSSAIWSKGPVSCSLNKKFLVADEKEFSLDPWSYSTGRDCRSAADGSWQIRHAAGLLITRNPYSRAMASFASVGRSPRSRTRTVHRDPPSTRNQRPRPHAGGTNRGPGWAEKCDRLGRIAFQCPRIYELAVRPRTLGARRRRTPDESQEIYGVLCYCHFLVRLFRMISRLDGDSVLGDATRTPNGPAGKEYRYEFFEGLKGN